MDGWITIGTKLDTKSFDKQIEEIEYELEQIDYELSHAKELKLDTRSIKEYEIRAEKLTNHLATLRKQQNDLNKSSLKEVSNSMDKIIKKVGKWALAVFGVRSAYMFIRQAMSTLTQYDQQLATDVEFIKYALATTLEPVIKFIVNLAYKLLAVINAIWGRLFGVSLFSKDLAKNFKSTKNSANSLKKTLTGFDEMNIVGGSGSNGGINLTPSFDPSKANENIEKWLDKLINKVKDFGQKIIEKIPQSLLQGLKNLWQGFIDQIAGIILIIKGLFTGSFEDIKTGLRNFVKGAGEILKGIIDVIKGINETVASVFGKIGKGFYNAFNDAWNGVKKLFGSGGKIFDGMKEGIVNAFKAIVNALISGINKAIAAPFNKINDLLNNIKKISILGAKPFNNLWSTNPIKVPQIPKLAKGGIVNMPSRGIPIGGALAGERGAEGVIPLTNSQQMALLGEAIGKYITINATVVNSMNGRVLSREIQKIQNQSDFAMNGRW